MAVWLRRTASARTPRGELAEPYQHQLGGPAPRKPMIYLCSCGFGTDDREWLQVHLFEHPGHHERPDLRLLAAALTIPDR